MDQSSAPVRRLFFGRDDAETDFTHGLLRWGFQPTAAYDAALTGRKTLIIGRKGSGKSAICHRLMAGYEGTALLITPDDAAGDEIRRFELQGVTADTAKSLIWRYTFAIQAARHLSAHARPAHGWRIPRAVRALQSFLQANDETGEDRLYERLRRGVRRLQAASLALKAFGVVEATAEFNGGTEGARALRQLEVLESGVLAAFEALRCTPQHEPLLILVDQLEQVWNIDPDSHAMVTGLLLAAKHVTRCYGGAVRCCLFLRSDIYDSLNFSDGDKFRSDELRISWTQPALRDMALTRASLSLEQSLTHEELWGGVFPATVEGEATSDYLFHRVLARPRDAIQFLTACRDVADGQAHPTVQPEDIVTATKQFSDWKLQDLAREYLVNHPFLKSLFTLFENHGYIVMRPALDRRFQAVQGSFQRGYPAYAERLTTQGVIDILYAVSFLGVKRGSDVVFAGDTQVPVQRHEDEFHIHPCFRPALGSTTAMGLPPYSPDNDVDSPPTKSSARSDAAAGQQISRDFHLLTELTRSCGRILNMVDRSDLPEPAGKELSGQIERVLHAARHKLDLQSSGKSVDSTAHVTSAANYFRDLRTRLTAGGVQDERVLRRLDEQANALMATVGGAVGSGGGSESSL